MSKKKRRAGSLKMTLIRALVCSAAFALALTPFATLAADTSTDHMQAELANGQAQWDLAQQQAFELEQQANQSAANERMIALLRSQSFRERQLSNVSNATAMEQIASALANAARDSGDLNARNELGIAQIKAAGLVAIADANLANGAQLAVTKGRFDELSNAQAQSNFLHQLANFITSTLAEQNMSNAKLIAQEQADAIHTPAIAEEENGLAMGADDVLAADLELAAGTLRVSSAAISGSGKAAVVLAHAAASLRNAQAMAAAAP
jgi:predicted ribonuclease toxin of YeeF-YezG toxin-antitoxin module